MKGSAAKIQMTGFDDLFGAPAPIADGEHIQEVALSDLHPFKNHPFHVVDDERMQETAESVAKYLPFIEKVILFHWNRAYPSDMKFPINLHNGKWTLLFTEDFAGSSHNQITMEVFTK